MNHLKLVSGDPPDLVYESLKPHLAQGLLPADPELLVILVPGLPESEALTKALASLVAGGRLRRIMVGAEAHLVDATPSSPVTRRGEGASAADPSPAQARVPAPHPTPPEPDNPPPAAERPASDSSDMDFELEVAIDVETERGVLWRVALVVAALALLALLRQWMLIGLSQGAP